MNPTHTARAPRQPTAEGSAARALALAEPDRPATAGAIEPYYSDATTTIYHGDCQEIMPRLAPDSIDLILTDPPFSVPVKYQDANGEHPRSWGNLAVMEPFFRAIFSQLRRVAAHDAHLYVSCDGDIYPVFFKVGYSLWPQSQLIVWYKPTGRRGRGWLHSHELVLHLRSRQTAYTDGFRQDVVGIMPVRTLEREHPAQKPGHLWSFLGDAFPGDGVVLDPFMGAGGALAYAKSRGMRAIGIEIEECYCERAAKALSQDRLFAQTL